VDVIEHTAGLLGSSVRLQASFLWLGQLGPTEPGFQVPPNDDRHPGAPPFHPGEFTVIHPYQGSACWQVMLRGILLPVSSCTDDAIRAQIANLQTAVGLAPIHSLDAIVQVRDALRILGPLDMSNHFRMAGATYLPFSVTALTYTWLAQHFAMATQMTEDPAQQSIQLQTTAPLPWASIQEFTVWLHRLPTNPLDPAMIATLILGAFIAPNSDACDGMGSLQPQTWVGDFNA
jgi:hypothetical protein